MNLAVTLPRRRLNGKGSLGRPRARPSRFGRGAPVPRRPGAPGQRGSGAPGQQRFSKGLFQGWGSGGDRRQRAAADRRAGGGWGAAALMAAIDYPGNCGNLSSAVGPFAIEEGMVKGRRAVFGVLPGGGEALPPDVLRRSDGAAAAAGQLIKRAGGSGSRPEQGAPGAPSNWAHRSDANGCGAQRVLKAVLHRLQQNGGKVG